MRAKLSRCLLAGLVSVAFAAPASAAVVVDLVETGTGVFGSFSGSLSLSGLTFIGDFPFPSGASIDAASGLFQIDGDVSAYRGAFTPAAYGPGIGGFGFATATSGVPLAIFTLDPGDNRIHVPSGYLAGAPLAGTIAFTGSTLVALGMAPGSYVTALPGGDSFTINVTAVPEPGAYALMLAGLGAVGFVARRRRSQAVAV